MCAGTAVLLGFKRVVIGERRSFQGAEAWLNEAGIEIACLNDPACEALMERMLQQKPELWAEDIGH
jgi:cytosine deaminase